MTTSSSSRFVIALSFAVAVLAATIGLGVTGATSNADWSVLAASGKAEWRDGPGRGSWQGLAANGSVPDGAEIRTGSDGSAVVAKGLDRIEVRADTSLVVAARGGGKGQDK